MPLFTLNLDSVICESYPDKAGGERDEALTLSNAGNRSSGRFTKTVVLGDPDKSSLQYSKFKKNGKEQSKHR